VEGNPEKPPSAAFAILLVEEDAARVNGAQVREVRIGLVSALRRYGVLSR
jgi:hypothetical protein